jgi:hypothetical protein
VAWDDEPETPREEWGTHEAWGETSEPLSDEELARQTAEAQAALKRLTLYGLAVTTLAASIAFVFWKTGTPGAEGFTKGVTIGGLLGVLNLRILARALWKLMSGDKLAPMLGLGASFALLLCTAFWLVQNYESWVMGFGVGLALPAPTGIWFAWSVVRREAR